MLAPSLRVSPSPDAPDKPTEQFSAAWKSGHQPGHPSWMLARYLPGPLLARAEMADGSATEQRRGGCVSKATEAEVWRELLNYSLQTM